MSVCLLPSFQVSLKDHFYDAWLKKKKKTKNLCEQADGTVKRETASSGMCSVVSGGMHQKALVSHQEPRGNT